MFIYIINLRCIKEEGEGGIKTFPPKHCKGEQKPAFELTSPKPPQGRFTHPTSTGSLSRLSLKEKLARENTQKKTFPSQHPFPGTLENGQHHESSPPFPIQPFGVGAIINKMLQRVKLRYTPWTPPCAAAWGQACLFVRERT